MQGYVKLAAKIERLNSLIAHAIPANLEFSTPTLYIRVKAGVEQEWAPLVFITFLGAGSEPMLAVLNLLDTVITLYIWLLVGSVILTWLVHFGVVNTSNRVVYMIGDFLHRITEPALRPIRNLLPDLGGIDISPVVLILALIFVRNLAFEYLV